MTSGCRAQIFHIATIQYNSPCPTSCFPPDAPATPANIGRGTDCDECPINPVWLQYQQPKPHGQGGEATPALSTIESFKTLVLCCAMCLLMVLYENLVVNGWVARHFAARFPRRVPLKL